MKGLNCTKIIHNLTLILVFLSYVIAILLGLISCGNSSKKCSTSENSLIEVLMVASDGMEGILDEYIDIPITVNLSHAEDEFIRSLVDAEYEITRETDRDVYIDINSEYYKKYISGHRFKVPKLAFFVNSEKVEFLTMDLDIVNNTNERLSISELNVIVKESTLDTLPVIYICTTADRSNCIYFVNESWFNWQGFTFSYSILGKDESFDGEYKNSQHIAFFDDYTIVDLLPDMEEMGYDFDELVNCIRNRDTGLINIDDCLLFYIDSNDDEFFFFQEKFKPFELKKEHISGMYYVGMASLYGSIKFDDSDFVVDFIADISLSTGAGFGSASYENDEFDVMLKSSGNDYKLRFPYTTVIEPRGTEMIKLTVNADKSSLHKFYVDVKNDNGLKIRSKNIHFHHYHPKN